MSGNVKPRLYLDTSALNYLYDEYIVKERSSDRIRQCYDVLVSYYLLSEVFSSDKDRARRLALCLWKTADHRILTPHTRLIFAEMRKALGLVPNADYFCNDLTIIDNWSGIATGSSNQREHEMHRDLSQKIKKSCLAENVPLFASQEAAMLPYLEKHGVGGIMSAWPFNLLRIIENRTMQQLIYNRMQLLCKHDPILFPSSLLPNKELVEEMDYWSIPLCTACGFEYMMALAYCALCKRRVINKGDLDDLKHAFYAGYADDFVTRDRKMYMILNEMVFSKRSKIYWAEDFVASLRN